MRRPYIHKLILFAVIGLLAWTLGFIVLSDRFFLESRHVVQSIDGLTPPELEDRKHAERPRFISNTTSKARKVDFMTLDSMIDSSAGRFTYHGAYSGMYWIDRQLFLRINSSMIHYLEEASHLPMQMVGNNNVLLTRDWLDMGVEHLSRFHRTMHVSDMTSSKYYFDKLVDIQKSYLRRVQPPWKSKGSAFSETMAVIPFFVAAKSVEVVLNTIDSSYLSRPQMVDTLVSLALASTIASLWQAGIGRVVVAGNAIDAPWTIQGALTILRNLAAAHKLPPLELDYVCAYDTSTFPDATAALVNRLLVPTDAIRQLQLAMNGQVSQMQQSRWLGNSPNRWKFIYYSEPDLILHTRPSAINALSAKVRLGKLIAAHRFQPLPHVDNFPGNPISRKVVPRLQQMVDLDQYQDSCCDVGNRWPGLTQFAKCMTQWHDCGLSNRKDTLTELQAAKQHERLLPYPMIRLMGGTQTYVISSHGRLCEPRKNKGCS